MLLNYLAQPVLDLTSKNFLVFIQGKIANVVKTLPWSLCDPLELTETFVDGNRFATIDLTET